MTHRYFLVNGIHKSGTTWVQRLCNAHPEMACRAEDQFPKLGGEFFKPVYDYNATIERADRDRDGQGTVPFTDMDVASALFHMVRLALDKAPDEVLWSGTKDNLMSVEGFLRFMHQSKVVHVVRDPRDLVVSSWASKQRLAGTSQARIDRPPQSWADEVSSAWAKVVAIYDQRRRSMPDRVHVLRYEDLFLDFNIAASKLFSFIGVANDAELLDKLRATTSFKALSGGRAAGDEDARSFFRSGIAGDWRGKLAPEVAARIAETCAEPMALYGYATE
jgi:hypothetical protein